MYLLSTSYKNMDQKIKKIILLFIIFICSFLLTGYIIDKNNLIEKLFLMNELKLENDSNFKWIVTLINGIFSIMIANLFNIAKIYLDKKRDNKENLPIISIKIKLVTLIRKNRRKDRTPEIIIGEGECFVYINSILKNIGNGVIEKCSINGQELGEMRITSDNIYEFNFRVCRMENKEFREYYYLEICFKDDRERSYKKKMKLKINESKNSAEVLSHSKQKRRQIR